MGHVRAQALARWAHARASASEFGQMGLKWGRKLRIQKRVWNRKHNLDQPGLDRLW